MAKKLVYLDDLDSTEIADGDGGPVTFSLGDEYFTMDLSSKSLAKLQKALQPFMDKAMSVEPPAPEPVRRGRGPAKMTRTKVTGDSPEYRAAVRAWANANDMPVGDRGRIKQEIYTAYEAAKGTP